MNGSQQKLIDVFIGVGGFHRKMDIAILKKFPDSKSNFVRMSDARKQLLARELLKVAVDTNCVSEDQKFRICYMDDHDKVCSLTWWAVKLNFRRALVFKVTMELNYLANLGDHGNWIFKTGAEVAVECDPAASGCSGKGRRYDPVDM